MKKWLAVMLLVSLLADITGVEVPEAMIHRVALLGEDEAGESGAATSVRRYSVASPKAPRPNTRMGM